MLDLLRLVVNLIAKVDKQNNKEISGALRNDLIIIRIMEITKV